MAIGGASITGGNGSGPSIGSGLRVNYDNHSIYNWLSSIDFDSGNTWQYLDNQTLLPKGLPMSIVKYFEHIA